MFASVIAKWCQHNHNKIWDVENMSLQDILSPACTNFPGYSDVNVNE